MAGGLGNQLFQYCFALHLSKQMQASLHLDIYSGFLRDPFRRNFELEPIIHDFHKLPFISTAISILLLKISALSTLYPLNKLFLVLKTPALKVLKCGRFALLSECAPIPSFDPIPFKCDFLRISGYWQSPNLFVDSRQQILDAFSNYAPTSSFALEMGQRLRSSETIAVGVRLYEETPNPELNSHNNEMKSIADLNYSFIKLMKMRPKSQVAVFCSHRSPLLNNLSLPSNTIYLTGDDSVPSAIDTLWLMSQCKHHIFLNSSLYWWAAFFSQLHHNAEEQIIFASNNFINQSCYLDGWIEF